MRHLPVLAVVAGMMLVMPTTRASAGGNTIDYLAVRGTSCVPGAYSISFETSDTSGRARVLELFVQGPDPDNPGSATWIFSDNTRGKGLLDIRADDLSATLGWNYMAEAQMWALNGKGQPTKLLDVQTIYFLFTCPS